MRIALLFALALSACAQPGSVPLSQSSVDAPRGVSVDLADEGAVIAPAALL